MATTEIVHRATDSGWTFIDAQTSERVYNGYQLPTLRDQFLGSARWRYAARRWLVAIARRGTNASRSIRP